MRNVTGLLPRLAVGALLLLPAAVQPLLAEPADISLTGIVARSVGRTLTREALAEGPAGLLAAAAAVDRFEVTCATPLLRHAAIATTAAPRLGQPDVLKQVRGLLAVPPVLPAMRTHVTTDGRFAIHYRAGARATGLLAIDRDGDRLPDLVNRVIEMLEAARSHLTDLDYPDPVNEGAPLEVYLTPLGRGLEGYVSRPAASPPAGAAGPFVVLDSALASGRIGAAVMHQMAHLSLGRLATHGAAWWEESTASFLSLLGTGDVAAHAGAIRARLESAGRGLASDDLLLMQGTILWPIFLAERTGDTRTVLRIWEAMAARQLDPLTAIDTVLQRTAGLTLAGAFREFAAWNLFTGSRDDGRHYRFGHALPEAIMPVIGPGVPFDLGPVEPVEPLGSIAFRLPSDGGVGSLDVDLQAEGGRPAADLLLFYRDGGPLPVLVPLVPDANGFGATSIPWDEVLEVWIVLRNEARDGRSARFEIRGVLDPYAPYDLASFTAQPVGATILLEWTTASEKGLIGWNIYRATRPTGPFLRLHDVAVPAFGDGAGETGYIFVDDSVRPGRRYYYLVEGLTRAGLTQRSHLASARTPADH